MRTHEHTRALLLSELLFQLLILWFQNNCAFCSHLFYVLFRAASPGAWLTIISLNTCSSYSSLGQDAP